MSNPSPTVPANAPKARGYRWLWAPPGVLFFAITAVVVLVAFDGDSRMSWGTILLAQVLWLVVGGIWFVRFLGAAWRERLRFPVRRLVRWLAVPAVFVLALVVVQRHVPYDVRLALSRGAMDQAAAEVMAGGSTDRAWIGLYPVDRVELTPNGMRFLIAGSGFINTIGFAFSTAGSPTNVDGNDDYEPLDRGWWTWVDRF